jgi:hypothetical protein
LKKKRERILLPTKCLTMEQLESQFSNVAPPKH